MSRSCLSNVFISLSSALTFCPSRRPVLHPRARAMVAFKGVWTKSFWRAVSAEFLATLLFILLGLGSTVDWASSTETPPPADLVLISLCFGLAVATMVQCFAHISGCHINPAVSAALLVVGRLSLAKALFYVAAQCLGAVAGAGILHLITPSAVRGGLGVTKVNQDISVGHALLVELLITFELIFTVMATCDSKRSDLTGSAGLAIGFAVVIGHLFAIPYTGASMNPARSFGPALITWTWEHHWVYWLGPILGGMLAAALYEYLYCPDAERKRRCRELFSKDASGKYKEAECSSLHQAGDPDELTIKPGSSMEMDKAGKKEPLSELSADVLSSV